MSGRDELRDFDEARRQEIDGRETGERSERSRGYRISVASRNGQGREESRVSSLRSPSSSNGTDSQEPESKGDPDLSSHSSLVSLRANFPEPLGNDAYFGLAGEIVRTIEPHSEADLAAVMASTLTMFGNAVGYGPYFIAGDARHATNLFAAIVGATSDGRKGTSAESPRRLLTWVDEAWLACIASGLASGEGLIHHIRDARNGRRKAKKGEAADEDGMVEELVDSGVDDKRLLVLAPEFAQVLGVIAREGNTLSATLRELWDRDRAQTLSKGCPERTSKSLVSLIAHITPDELRARLDTTEVANGFANRFIYVASRRSKFLPRGGNVPEDKLVGLASAVDAALRQARLVTEVGIEAEAWELWEERYRSLVERPPGLMGALTGRAAPIVRRLALVYALLDSRPLVTVDHLRAALEVWRYSEDSVRWVFGDRLGDRVADQCLVALLAAGEEGLSRTELWTQLQRHTTAHRMTDALQSLADAQLARCVHVPTKGRPAERWYATTRERSERSERSERRSQPHE